MFALAIHRPKNHEVPTTVPRHHPGPKQTSRVLREAKNLALPMCHKESSLATTHQGGNEEEMHRLAYCTWWERGSLQVPPDTSHTMATHQLDISLTLFQKGSIPEQVPKAMFTGLKMDCSGTAKDAPFIYGYFSTSRYSVTIKYLHTPVKTFCDV